MRRAIGITLMILVLSAYVSFVYWAKWGQYHDDVIARINRIAG